MQTNTVLIVSSEFPPQPGGIGEHAYNLANQLALNGYLVRVVADCRSVDGEEEAVFDGSLPFEVHRVRITSLRFFMYLKRLRILFRLIWHTHHVIATGKFSLWSSAFCSWFYKRNYVAVIHGSEVNFKSYVLRTAINNALKRFDTIVAVSHYTKALIAHLHLEVVVIPNGFNQDKWDGQLQPSLPLKGHPKLMTVGNVTRRKGQQQVIQHLPKLLEQFPEVHYHCVGLPTEAEAFQALAQELHVQDHVTFHGRVSDGELQELLLGADLFVMLSSETATGDVEGFGIAILEANALGVPAIGSIGCGIEDAIDDQRSGILIPSTDADAFIRAIQRIMEDRDHYRDYAKDWAKRHQWTDLIHRYIAYLP